MHVFVGLLRQDFGSEGYAIERAFKGRLGLLQKKKIEKTFSEREHKGLSAFSKMREAKGARFFCRIEPVVPFRRDENAGLGLPGKYYIRNIQNPGSLSQAIG